MRPETCFLKFQSGGLNWRHHFVDTKVLKKWDVDWIYLVQDKNQRRSCEDVNDSSGSIKNQTFVDHLSDY
jgi:hypothetical protein